jgi:hypothetical protein
VWAEEFGIGEMGLSPAVFWRLNVREFWIKHRAFTRAEDRARSLMLEHAALLGQFKDKDRNSIRKSSNVLRRYPVKQWLMSD